MIKLFDNFCARLLPEEIDVWIYSNQNSLRWLEYSYVTEENGMPIRLYAIFGSVTFAESLR